jgi:hypothetical protein
MQSFAIVVLNKKLTALPIEQLPVNLDRANRLCELRARTAEEAEDRYMKIFCPPNFRFIAH